MVVNNIKVFARLRDDCKPQEKCSDISISSKGKCEDIIFRRLGRGEECARACRFRFTKIFDETKDQKSIFDTVAQPVVTSVLQGFNGTIFAYGQTGSGKTFTMTGSSKKYEERGVIPRSLQHIFSTIEKTEEKPTLYISYMEIYNEICYDLLSPRDHKTASRLEELPRVIILEDRKGEARLRNLSVLPVSTEEEAMRLLFLGDTNRAIAETPLNEYSSRSHCIFTVYITSKHVDGENMMVYSKLNLVDLSGSERVHKSKITGNILNEAKHINVSLHFLQQVILALSESKRTHIPYRNSLMTFILKDSLAGNCLTVMLVTLALSRRNIQETISTCKFAQRVSLIRTDPVINEVSDPYQEILLLKNEVQELRKQLLVANKKPISLLQETLPVSRKQTEDIEGIIDNYLKSKDSTKLEVDPGLYQYCFSVLKNKLQFLESKLEEDNNNSAIASSVDTFNNKKYLTISGSEPALTEEEPLSGKQSPSEVDYYMKQLSGTYEKAQLLAAVIEECQVNINYLREKQDVAFRAGDSQRTFLLSKETEYQQRIYKKSLIELKELKNETLQLEAGLAKAKIKVLRYLNHHQNICQELNMKQTCLDEGSYKSHKNPVAELHSRRLFTPSEQPDNYFKKSSDHTTRLLPLQSNSSKINMDIVKKGPCHESRDYQSCNVACHCSFNSTEKVALMHGLANEVSESDPYKFGQMRKCGGSNECFNETLFLPRINRNTICFPDKSCDPRAINMSMPREPSRYHKSNNYCCQEKASSSYLDHPLSACRGSYCLQSNTNQCSCDCFYQKSAQPSTNNCSMCILETNNAPTIVNNQVNIIEKSCNFENNEIQIIPNKLCDSLTQAKCVDDRLKSPSPKCEERLGGNTISRKASSIIVIDENKDNRREETLKTERDANENTATSDNCLIESPSDSTYDIFIDADTGDFRQFMSTVPLTGNEDIDKEICNFYRTKICP